MKKRRLSASVDDDVLRQAEAIVKRGGAANISAWVNLAMQRQLEHDRRMEALDAFLEDFQAEHGAISAGEIAQATRWARERAIVVRQPGKSQRRTSRSA